MLYKREMKSAVDLKDAVGSLDMGDVATLSELNHRADTELTTTNSEMTFFCTSTF